MGEVLQEAGCVSSLPAGGMKSKSPPAQSSSASPAALISVNTCMECGTLETVLSPGLHPSGAQVHLPQPKEHPSSVFHPPTPGAQEQVGKAPVRGGPGHPRRLWLVPSPHLQDHPSTKKQPHTAEREATLPSPTQHSENTKRRKGAQLWVPRNPQTIPSRILWKWSTKAQVYIVQRARREGVGTGRRRRRVGSRLLTRLVVIPPQCTRTTPSSRLCLRQQYCHPTQNENLDCPQAQALLRGRSPHITCSRLPHVWGCLPYS